MASIQASEYEPEPEPERGTSRVRDGTRRDMVVGSKAVKALLVPLSALVALRACDSSESAASAESRTLSQRFSPAPT